MNKIVLAVFSILAVGFFAGLASAVEYNAFNYPNLNFGELRYEPVPASPGGVVDLWFTIKNTGTQPTQNASFQLKLSYPFYLDSGETALKQGKVIPSNETALVSYKIRVREDAASGDYKVTLDFCRYPGACNSREVTIKVTDAKTDFDIVVQDVSQGQVSLAVSNTGRNAANAVTIRAKGQREAASIIGTLTAGDYTIVSIPLSVAYGAVQPQELYFVNLSIQVSYTDSLGNREHVSKVVGVDPVVSGSWAVAQPAGQRQGRGGFDPLAAAIGVIVVIVIAYFAYTRLRSRRRQVE